MFILFYYSHDTHQANMSFGGFLRRNIVVVLVLPALAAIHVGWYNLQFNDKFVPEKDRKLKVLGLNLHGDSVEEKIDAEGKK